MLSNQPTLGENDDRCIHVSADETNSTRNIVIRFRLLKCLIEKILHSPRRDTNILESFYVRINGGQVNFKMSPH